MPDLIQFDCPSCSATLRIPLEMAGLRGPCPICHLEIIAPNPYTGIGAHFPPHQPPPEIETLPIPSIEPEPSTNSVPGTEPAPAPANHPFADRLIDPAPVFEPLPISSPPPASHFETETAPAAKIAKPARRWPLVFIGFCFVLLALAGGFFLGNHFRPDPAEQPIRFNLPPRKSTTPAPPAVPPPAADPAAKTTPSPSDKPAPVSKTSLESAQTTLRAFLEAPDWAARSAYVLSPHTVRAKMEAYAKINDDGPTPFTKISVEHSQVDAESGTTLFIFKIESPAVASGIPVAVLETKKGWFVDWESFVEFRDDQFKEFAEGPSDHVGEFHVIVTAPDPASGGHSENETYSSFIIAPPLPGRQKTAFIKKTSSFYPQLRDATANGRPFFPVLKISKSTTNDGRSYLEILSIEASDWHPHGAIPEP